LVCLIFAVLWQPFWKWQTSWKFLKDRIAPLMVIYHYVKFYASIIIDLEVININVWNFNFPIEAGWSYRYMFLVGPKVYSFVVKGVKVIFWGVQRGGRYYRILWES
jgi:hypothetical protein